jgi:hypothetical protein
VKVQKEEYLNLNLGEDAPAENAESAEILWASRLV